MTQAVRQHFTFEAYLALEEGSTVKHEYLDGLVWAMAGGSPDHAGIAANITALLVEQLRDKPCRVFSADLRVRVVATGLCTYPDVTVICGQLEPDSADASGNSVTNPRVLIEVLSPSTEAYDRGEKLSHYQQIEGLDEVVLVAHDRKEIEVWRREDNLWTAHRFAGAHVAQLTTIECRLPLEEVYRDPLAR